MVAAGGLRYRYENIVRFQHDIQVHFHQGGLQTESRLVGLSKQVTHSITSLTCSPAYGTSQPPGSEDAGSKFVRNR